MIQRVLGIIAGVDRKTLESCPASDKLWAAHLGASLCLSFIVVLGVSFHASGYMIESVSTRLLVSSVIALTVLMFDRALCQSDWFYQGTLWNTAPIVSNAEAKQTAWRFVRVGIRLAMSFGLAWVIAMFLELAIFSGTINEKIEADRVAANQPIYEKIAKYEGQLSAEVKRRQAGIDELEALHRAALTETPAQEPTTKARADEIDQQIKALNAREVEVRGDIAEIGAGIQRYTVDMNAEEYGLKASPGNSGRPGAGPRYEFARKQREALQAQRAEREAEINQLHLRREELRAAQAKVSVDAVAAREQDRVAIKAKADALQARIDDARLELKQFETQKAVSVEAFRKQALAESYYQDKRDRIDPLTRIAAYQELKNDPKDGGTMTLFSWMTRFFIIFLEIVPVVAKIFFSPPSVYAAKIQAEVERARQRIENNEDLEDDKPTPVVAVAPQPAAAAPLEIANVEPVKAEAPKPAPAAAPMTARADERRDDDYREPRRRPAYERDEAPRYAPRGYRHFEDFREADWRGDRRSYAARDDDDYVDPRRFSEPRYDDRHYDERRRAASWREMSDERSYDDERPRREPVRRPPTMARNDDDAPHEQTVRAVASGTVHSDLDMRNLIVPKHDTAAAEPAAPIRQPVTAAPDPQFAEPTPQPTLDAATSQAIPAGDVRGDALLQEKLAAEPVDVEQLALATEAIPPVPATPAAQPPFETPTPAFAALPGRPVELPAFLPPHRPAAGAQPSAAPADLIGTVQKYNADVERLMSEAMELSRGRKRPPRRDHHGDEAELPLEHPAHYETLPKA